MKNITPAMKAHIELGLATLAACWRIKRRDGKEFRYTEHDEDIEYLGDVYSSVGGFNKSAIKSSGTLAIDNLDVTGFLTDDTISDAEVRNGAFDYAEVEIFLVNYMDTSPIMGDIKMRFGYFGEVSTVPSGAFIVQLRGLVDLLAKRIGDVYVPECRLDLGESKCGVPLIPPVWQANAPYKAGDRVLMPLNEIEGLNYFKPIRLPGMWDEDGSIGFPNNVLAKTISATMNLAPIDGQKMINITYHDFQGSRRCDLITEVGITQSAIDSGNYTIRGEVWMTGLEYGQHVTIRTITRRASGSINNTVNKDVGQLPTRKWQKFTFEHKLQANDRTFAFLIGINKVTSNSLSSTVIDAPMFFLDTIKRPPYEDYRIFGGYEMIALQDGQSGSVLPDMDVTLGASTPDGTTAWTAEAGKWMWLNEVLEVPTGSYQLKLKNPLPVDDPSWLEWGVCRWLTGKNAGFAVETLSYSTVDGYVLTFALPVPYPTEQDAILQIQVGCDKRFRTCVERFNNGLQFRGHPDVPGQGQYFKVAGL